MARRKKRRVHHRRRRMSGVDAKGILTKVAGIGAGIFAGRLLTSKLAATLNPKISGAVAILAGVMLPKYLKSELGQGLGNGLVAAGVLAELQSFNIISGIGNVPGSYAMIATGNNYDANKARTVGAPGGRPIMKSTVGHAVNGVNDSYESYMNDLRTMGALVEE